MKSADKTTKADCDTPFSPVQRDFHMRIDQEGRWYHEGDLIKRIELVKLFAKVLSVDERDSIGCAHLLNLGRSRLKMPFVITALTVPVRDVS